MSLLESVYVSCATTPQDRKAISENLVLLYLRTSSSRCSVVKIFLHVSILLRKGRPSAKVYPRAFSKLDDYQSEYKDILFLLHFEYLCHVFSSLIRLIPSDALDEIRYSWKQF